MEWDGLDHRRRIVPSGAYKWRLVSSDGFTARYLTSIGINPPGGENSIPQRSWVGDHLGPGILPRVTTGIYIGSPFTKEMMMVVTVDPTLSRVDSSPV